MQETFDTQNSRLQQLSGSIERVIYANEENGYAVCDLGTDDDLVTRQQRSAPRPHPERTNCPAGSE